MPGRRRQLVLLIALAVLAVAALVAVQRWGVVPLVQEAIVALRVAGPVPFFAAMALVPACGVPVSVFTVPAVPAFGPALGPAGLIAATLLALAVNMALTYWLAACGLRRPVEWLVRRAGYRMPTLPGGTERDIILLVRLVPGPPFFLQNYLLGLARVPFGPYLVISLLVSGTYAALTILVLVGALEGNLPLLLVAAVALPVVFVAIRRLRARLRRPPGDGKPS